MAPYREPVGGEAEYLAALLEAGLLVEVGVPGVYGRGQRFEDVCLGVDGYITRVAAADDAEHLRFPPVIPRRIIEDTGYLQSFPHLAGTIFSFEGDEAAARDQEEQAARHDDWSGHQHMTDMALVPAACYPVYPAIARRGRLPAGGVTVDAGAAFVFRHEPAGDPARLQVFRQREMVRIGEPEVVQAWRDAWRSRAVELLGGLGLTADAQVATDPFFGRSGRMLAANQRAQELKYEVTIPIASPENTAVASFNYHQDHFAHVFGLASDASATVHTACLGFGIERIALGLFRAHGLDTASWPAVVTGELWP